MKFVHPLLGESVSPLRFYNSQRLSIQLCTQNPETGRTTPLSVSQVDIASTQMRNLDPHSVACCLKCTTIWIISPTWPLRKLYQRHCITYACLNSAVMRGQELNVHQAGVHEVASFNALGGRLVIYVDET